MTTIRPNAFPQPPLAGQREEPGKLAAQRAFFAAVTGRSEAAPTVTAAQPAPAAPAEVNRVAVAPETPAKILRPGSLLDIRV